MMLRYSAALLLLLMIVSADAATVPDLPEPVSNNAVAQVEIDTKTYFFSFMGLAKDKTYDSIHNKAWRWREGDSQWQPISAVPHVLPIPGRLASTAIGVNGSVYLFGGYTVDAKGEEISAPDSYRYDPRKDEYLRISDMPIAVDDTAAVAYQDRYIYLLSGWHNHGNVNLVQVYDIQTDTWEQATPLPIPAVFGQAAAIIDEKIVMCDGVQVVANLNKPRTFRASRQCILGKIDPNSHLQIHWQRIPHFSGSAYYRMAAGADKNNQQILFVGGSANPYNFNGIGYNGRPSAASNLVHRFDLNTLKWLSSEETDSYSMDHRGLLTLDNHFYLLGGMAEQQQTTNKIRVIAANKSK